MGKRTKAQVQADIDRLSAELEDADSDDEVYIQDSSGHVVKITGNKATAILGRYRTLWDNEPDTDDTGPDADTDGNDDGAGGTPDKPLRAVNSRSVWRRGGTADDTDPGDDAA